MQLQAAKCLQCFHSHFVILAYILANLALFIFAVYSVTDVRISPDTSCVCVGGNDKNAVVFNKDTEQVVAILQGHGKKVTSVIYHPDEVQLFRGCSVIESAHDSFSNCSQSFRVTSDWQLFGVIRLT